VWRPAADIYETAGEVVVTVELPGVEEDDIDLMLYEDALVLQGQRRLPRPQEDSHYHSAEIRQGSYRLEVPLRGEVDRERVEARYDRGMLTVRLPKVGPS
jgi:HSP20 family protein